MSVGLPSIVLNIGGPSCIIDKTCGIIIDVNKKDQNQIINEIYNELNYLINNKSKLEAMSENCLVRIKNFLGQIKLKKFII